MSAVLVHYRTPEALARCVGSLSNQTIPPHDVVVVDNSAHEDGPVDVHSPSVHVRVVHPKTNLGFGAACNLGARVVRSDYLLFVNPDVLLEPRAVAALLDRAMREPSTAVVAPRIYGADGDIERNARSFPTVKTGLLGRRSLVTRLLARIDKLPRELQGSGDEAARVDWVSGACILVRVPAFREIGGFDERYWMYWEDADLCWRLRERDWRTWFDPTAVAHHATGSSGRSPLTIRAFHDSAIRFATSYLARGWAAKAAAHLLLRTRMWLVLARHALDARVLPIGRRAKG